MHASKPSLWREDSALRIHRLTTPAHPGFEAAYALLSGFFAEKGQIESREQTAALLERPWTHRGLHCAFPMVYAEDLAGEPVAVAQRYVVFDPEERLLMGLDGSVFCAPPWRGQGLAMRLSALLWEDAAATWAPRSIVDLGDLEPVSEADPDSGRRARLWGRRGYRFLPPACFPLRLCGMEGEDEPVPMWAIVRFPGEDPQPEAVPRALLRKLALGLEAAHAWAPGADAYTPALLAAIEAGPDPAPLLPL